jgi:hypothetical protein
MSAILLLRVTLGNRNVTRTFGGVTLNLALDQLQLAGEGNGREQVREHFVEGMRAHRSAFGVRLAMYSMKTM